MAGPLAVREAIDGDTHLVACPVCFEPRAWVTREGPSTQQVQKVTGGVVGIQVDMGAGLKLSSSMEGAASEVLVAARRAASKEGVEVLAEEVHDRVEGSLIERLAGVFPGDSDLFLSDDRARVDTRVDEMEAYTERSLLHERPEVGILAAAVGQQARVEVHGSVSRGLEDRLADEVRPPGEDGEVNRLIAQQGGDAVIVERIVRQHDHVFDLLGTQLHGGSSLGRVVQHDRQLRIALQQLIQYTGPDRPSREQRDVHHSP